MFWGGSWKDSPDAYTTRKLYHCGDRICDVPGLNFSDTSIRKYWDADLKLLVDRDLKLLVDRDVNAAINIKRVGLDLFPTIKRRKGGIAVVWIYYR